MNKDVILSRAGEQLEECTILYYRAVDGDCRVYFDKEYTRCLTADEMREAFTKRCIVDLNGRYLFAPTGCVTNPDGSATLQIYAYGDMIDANSVEYVKP